MQTVAEVSSNMAAARGWCRHAAGQLRHSRRGHVATCQVTRAHHGAHHAAHVRVACREAAVAEALARPLGPALVLLSRAFSSAATTATATTATRTGGSSTIPPPGTFAATALPSQVVTDLGAIKNNVRRLRRLVGPGVVLAPALKANAYGHGAVGVAAACVEAGADWIVVASMAECMQLRESGERAACRGMA